jgi:hypothetical protein
MATRRDVAERALQGLALAGFGAFVVLGAGDAPWAWFAAIACSGTLVAVAATRRRRTVRAARYERHRARTERPSAPTGHAARLPEPTAYAMALMAASSHDDPLVTVVVTAKDEQTYLTDALTSVLEQSFPHWRCVVVDDGSSDNSLDIALAAAESDHRFSVLAADTPRGLSAARNAGLSVATTPYVTFLDGDDLLLPWSLEARIAQLSGERLQAGVYSEWLSIAHDQEMRTIEPPPATRRPTMDFLSAAWDTPCIVTAPILSTHAVRSCGAFDESFDTTEDMDFFHRLLRGGYHLDFSGSRDVAYRSKPGSMLLADPSRHFAGVLRVSAARRSEWEPWSGAPMPFTLPLEAYLRDDALLERALAALSLSIAQGNAPPRAVTDWVQALPHELVTRAAVVGKARIASRRALTRLAPDRTPERGDVHRLAVAVLTVVRDATATAGSSAGPSLPGPVAAVPDDRYATVAPVRSEQLGGGAFVDRRPFLVFADARYHVYESGPLLVELRSRGIDAVACVPANSRSGPMLHDWARFTDVVYTAAPQVFDGLEFSGVFLLNDWSATANAAIPAARCQGAITFAKVEGVQDFTDADTGRIRRPYQHADVIFAQGANDVRALPTAETVIVGSSRLEGIWRQPAVGGRPPSALFNLNFTYNVLTDAAAHWITSGADVCIRAGIDYSISAHAAQKDAPSDPRVESHIRREPFRYLVQHTGVLVSRFSTVPFEAMARGVPFIYYNPHGEKVPTFTDPRGCFEIASTADELGPAIEQALARTDDVRASSAPFFLEQVDIGDVPSHVRTADAICDRLATRGLLEVEPRR